MSRRPYWLLRLALSLAFVASAAIGLGVAPPPGRADSSSPALVLLSGSDLDRFHATIEAARDQGGEVTLAYPPAAFIANLSASGEAALRQEPAVARIERRAVDPTTLRGAAETAARAWNLAFQGVRDPAVPSPPPGPPGSDVLIAPPEPPGSRAAPGAPSSTQTSEFMAGTIAVSVVFVESSGGAGNCSPADPQT